MVIIDINKPCLPTILGFIMHFMALIHALVLHCSFNISCDCGMPVRDVLYIRLLSVQSDDIAIYLYKSDDLLMLHFSDWFVLICLPPFLTGLCFYVRLREVYLSTRLKDQSITRGLLQIISVFKLMGLLSLQVSHHITYRVRQWYYSIFINAWFSE